MKKTGRSGTKGERFSGSLRGRSFVSAHDDPGFQAALETLGYATVVRSRDRFLQARDARRVTATEDYPIRLPLVAERTLRGTRRRPVDVRCAGRSSLVETNCRARETLPRSDGLCRRSDFGVRRISENRRREFYEIWEELCERRVANESFFRLVYLWRLGQHFVFIVETEERRSRGGETDREFRRRGIHFQRSERMRKNRRMNEITAFPSSQPNQGLERLYQESLNTKIYW